MIGPLAYIINSSYVCLRPARRFKHDSEPPRSADLILLWCLFDAGSSIRGVARYIPYKKGRLSQTALRMRAWRQPGAIGPELQVEQKGTAPECIQCFA